MFIKENIMLAVAGLKANKMRAVLTMLGIIIGIASVIGIVSVGNAMTSSVTSSMADMGTTNIMVNITERSSTSSSMIKKSLAASDNNSKSEDNEATSTDEQAGSQEGQPDGEKDGNKQEEGGPGGEQGGMPGAGGGGGMPGAGGGGGMPGGGGGGGMPGGGGGGGMPGGGGRPGSSSTSTPDDSDLMSMSMIDELVDTFSDKIDAVSVSESKTSGKAKDGTAYANVSVQGTNVGYADVKNIEIINGRYISQKDVDGAKKVAVVSDKLVAKIFGENTDPIGQQVKIYSSSAIYTYTIVGVYKYESSGTTTTSSEENLSTDLYIPITTGKTSSSNKNYQSLTIKAKDDIDIQDFTDEIQTYMDKIYARNADWEPTVSNMESMLESMTSMMSTMALAISAIAGISLLVGGIGVMNIMLVSVTERTREIGTRKALGAKSGHIQMQFIVESMIICAIGGLIGIALGIVFGIIGSKLMGYPAAISTGVVIGSFAFSMVIGIFFGYYPAKKAAKLDPIEALRYE